jgi:hypothetical protein
LGKLAYSKSYYREKNSTKMQKNTEISKSAPFLNKYYDIPEFYSSLIKSKPIPSEVVDRRPGAWIDTKNRVATVKQDGECYICLKGCVTKRVCYPTFA